MLFILLGRNFLTGLRTLKPTKTKKNLQKNLGKLKKQNKTLFTSYVSSSRGDE